MRSSRRRTTSKMDVDEETEPQPSTSTGLPRPNAVSTHCSELLARLLSRIRAIRDKREARLIEKLRYDLPEAAENELRDAVQEHLVVINNHIQSLEMQTSRGLILEELLNDPQYNLPSILSSKPQSPPMKSPRSPRSPIKRTLPPIEVKVEDTQDSETSTIAESMLSLPLETNIEKAAKQEAQVMSRIAELRRNGLWTTSRLPLCVEPSRNKTHWDYLLEEMKWMANDFRQERIIKRTMSKKIAGAIMKQRKDQEQQVERSEQRRLREGKRICATIAKMVRDFWQNVDKLVDHRAQVILETKKRRALDQHLAFIVGEADKLSNMVQEGLTVDKTSKSPSVSSKLDDDDRDFYLGGDANESDDERTIAREEKALKNHDVAGEISALNEEATQDMDDLLASLPPEYVAMLTAGQGSTAAGPNSEAKESDDEEVEEGDEEESEEEEEESVKEDANDTGKSEEAKGEDSMDVDESTQQSINISDSIQDDEGNGDGRGMLDRVDYKKLNSENKDHRQEELNHIAEEALKFQPKGFTLETTQVKTEVPFLIRGTLREYQMVGVDWLVTLYEKNLNGILADEMGLGKTIQTIALLAHLACAESIWGPHLIVVPTSVILNWEMELKKWCPALKILTYFGSTKERAEKRKGWSKQNIFHVCITSYKTITTDIRAFKMKAWQYLILDEAQNIKNWKSQRWQALLNVRARRRLLLTGTPLQNSLMELWSLMHFLMPAVFASHDDFKDWFSNPLTGMMEGSVEYNAPLVQQLHKVLRPFILRRLKNEVEKQLPEKTEHVIKCQLSKRQRYLYDDFMSQRSTRDNLKGGNIMSVLNIVMQLRKCCNHPNLFEPRPVLSPFVLQQLRLRLPGMVFDLIGDDCRIEDMKEIPQSLDLRNRFFGWTSSVNHKRPKIEELRSWSDSDVVPRIEGFRFQRPPLNINGSSMASASASYELGNEDDTGLKRRIAEPEEGAEAEAKRRLVMNGDGRSCEPIGASLHSTSFVDGASFARVPFVVKSTKKVAEPHPSLRATTVMSSVTPLTVSTATSGFHHDMQNGGARQPIVDYNYQFSPPLKRKAIEQPSLFSGDYTDMIPNDVRCRMEDNRDERLKRARARFVCDRSPIFAKELLIALWTETRKVTRQDDSTWCWNGWDAQVQRLQEQHEEVMKNMVKRFILCVDTAQCDGPQVGGTSGGRSAMAIQSASEREYLARRTFENFHSLVDAKLLASRLQFPELRLIEYDCGKLQVMANLLRELYLYKHRCLIFTQMSKMLDVLQAFLSHHGYSYFRLDGTTGVEQRQAMMERFNADPKIFCFILSTRSGGVGVNLTGADTVIFYDSDWNPTMDAQAQDRCHRIGQTRNVSIYRLISERTIEENILRKATQKRRLGEMAIDAAGFTPEFFKQKDNIRELFDDEEIIPDSVSTETATVNQKELDMAMAGVEDEQDVAATRLATLEARADKAEFDDAKREQVGNTTAGEDPPDDRYMELVNQLKPIERYAVDFLEMEYKPEFEEEVKETVALIDQKKEEWQKAHVRAMNDDDTADEDFFGCNNLLDEILAEGPDFFDQYMPSWSPPTPPLSDGGDMYYDDCLDLLYDPDFMGEARLPSTIYELHRPLTKPPSPQKRHQPATSPVSLGPSATEQKVLSLLSKASMDSSYPSAYNGAQENFEFGPADFPEIKQEETYEPRPKQKRPRPSGDRQRERDLPRPITPPPAIREEPDYDGPEWSVTEDMALAEAVSREEMLHHSADRNRTALTFNWECIAGYVNRVTGIYRSPRQCCLRWQLVVRPRDANQLITVDPLTKKTRKVSMTNSELVHLRKGRSTTLMQYEHDAPRLLEAALLGKAEALKCVNAKKAVPYRRNIRELTTDACTGNLPDAHLMRIAELGVTLNPEMMVIDICKVQEEKIYQADQRKKANDVNKAELTQTTDPFRGDFVVARPPAIPASPGIVPSKTPLYLEVPSMQTYRPQQPSPQQVQIQQQVVNQQHMQVVQEHSMRRVQSAGGAMGGLAGSGVGMGGQQQHYPVATQGPPDSQRSYMGRQDMMPGGGQPMYRTIPVAQSKRASPALQQQQRMSYVPTSAPGNGGGGQPGATSVQGSAFQGTGNAIYSTGGQVMQARQQPVSRVMPRMSQPSGSRMFINPVTASGERAIIMGAAGQMRVVPTNRGVAQKRPMGATNKASGSQPVASMIMPTRQMTGQQLQALRAVPRTTPYTGTGTRINVVNILPQGVGSTLTRQLLQTRVPNAGSRGSSPQTVANSQPVSSVAMPQLQSASSVGGSSNTTHSQSAMSQPHTSHHTQIQTLQSPLTIPISSSSGGGVSPVVQQVSISMSQPMRSQTPTSMQTASPSGQQQQQQQQQ